MFIKMYVLTVLSIALYFLVYSIIPVSNTLVRAIIVLVIHSGWISIAIRIKNIIRTKRERKFAKSDDTSV